MKPDLVKFAEWALEQTEGIEPDDLWEVALQCGLLELTEVNEPCSDECTCAENRDFPTECYRRVPLREATKAGQTGQER